MALRIALLALAALMFGFHECMHFHLLIGHLAPRVRAPIWKYGIVGLPACGLTLVAITIGLGYRREAD